VSYVVCVVIRWLVLLALLAVGLLPDPGKNERDDRQSGEAARWIRRDP
jgi:hypothetical protein